MSSIEEITFMQPFCCYCESTEHNFRKTIDVLSDITCPVLLNTTCKKCNLKGHTTTRCTLTYEDEECCKYCHNIGHIKKNCPILGSMHCTYCNDMGHVRSRCFMLKINNKK